MLFRLHSHTTKGYNVTGICDLFSNNAIDLPPSSDREEKDEVTVAVGSHYIHKGDQTVREEEGSTVGWRWETNHRFF